MPESHVNWVFLPICQGSSLKLITNRQGSPWPLTLFLLTLLLVAWQLNSSILYISVYLLSGPHFSKGQWLTQSEWKSFSPRPPLWWSRSAGWYDEERCTVCYELHIYLNVICSNPLHGEQLLVEAARVSSQRWCRLFAPDSVLPWKWDCWCCTLASVCLSNPPILGTLFIVTDAFAAQAWLIERADMGRVVSTP